MGRADGKPAWVPTENQAGLSVPRPSVELVWRRWIRGVSIFADPDRLCPFQPRSTRCSDGAVHGQRISRRWLRPRFEVLVRRAQRVAASGDRPPDSHCGVKASEKEVLQPRSRRRRGISGASRCSIAKTTESCGSPDIVLAVESETACRAGRLPPARAGQRRNFRPPLAQARRDRSSSRSPANARKKHRGRALPTSAYKEKAVRVDASITGPAARRKSPSDATTLRVITEADGVRQGVAVSFRCRPEQ